MFKRRTLFILGAGSSFEAGLPVGVDLAKIIRQKMDVRFERFTEPIGDGDHDLFAHIAHFHRQEANAYLQAAWRIRAGLGFAQSIDDFLDQHRSDERMNLYGKAAIVRAILEAEAGSKFYFDRFADGDAFDPDKFANTWFAKFMHMLGRNMPRENVSDIFANVRFVIFNYDRCVEYFLYNALKRLYDLSEQDALSIINNVQFLHPYGVVGALSKVPYGSSRANYVELAAGIKTYTEQVAAADLVERLREEVSQSNCIVFLGFAYHSQICAFSVQRSPGPQSRFTAQPTRCQTRT